MKRYAMGTRIGLVVLAALLTLPLAPTASSVEAKQRTRTVTRTYRNTAAIHLPTFDVSPVSASNFYPSTIRVDGPKGTIRDVDLTLNGLTHGLPYDVQVLLVAPEGQAAVVMAGVGGADPAGGVTLRLDDEAAMPIPVVGPLASGTYEPSNIPGGPIRFNGPAPGANASSALSVFDGTNPNGTWRLFVQDAYGPTVPGYFAGGWELEITTKVKAKKTR